MIPQFIELVRDIYQTENFIPLHAPIFSARDKDYVVDAIDSTFVSSVSDYVGKFEQALSELTGAKHVIPVVNGTSGIHLALHALGVDAQCEVLTQSLTFVGTCNAIAYTGAKPVFVDVDINNMGFCPEALSVFLQENAELREVEGKQKTINKNTGKHIAACVPMHTFGHPVKISQLKVVCSQWNIAIVEDAAEALSSFVDIEGKSTHCGTVGEMGVLSFNGNKLITTGGGGAILTNDDALAKRLRHLSTTAKVPHAWEYEHDEIGFNYRMPGLNAALGCAQMEQISDFLADKLKITERYRNWSSEHGIVFIDAQAHTQPNFWLNALLLEDKQQRDEFLTETNQQGVMTRPIWQPMHLLKPYRDSQSTPLTNTLNIMQRLVNIPSSARVSS